MCRHGEGQVDQWEIRFQDRHGGFRVNRQTDFLAVSTEGLEKRHRIRQYFPMENQPIGPFLDEQWHELRRLAHHQVDFQRQPRDWTKTVYHPGSHAKVRNEMAVHDVDMDALSSRPLTDLDLVCPMAEIGC